MKKRLLSAILSAATLFISACGASGNAPDTEKTTAQSIAVYEETVAGISTSATTAVTETSAPPVSGDLTVHFLDVWQADCIYIELPNGETMLIDAGAQKTSDKVISYLTERGCKRINYLVATHPHNDHVGGMFDIFNKFRIDKVILSPIKDELSDLSTAQTIGYEYSLFISCITERPSIEVQEVMAGDVILDCGNLLIEVVAPKEIYPEELNNSSVVIKLTYGDRKFIFTGDCGKEEEDSIWTNIKCDVLKVAHHGSSTSTSWNFLKKTEPTHAVISVGYNNGYFHPHDALLKRLDKLNINVYRTDLQGDIIITTDGKDLSISAEPLKYDPNLTNTEPPPPIPVVAAEEAKYVLNTNSKRIHYIDCSSVADIKDKNKDYTNDFEAAIARGYKPCGACNPQ